jgi:hypothetical protein
VTGNYARSSGMTYSVHVYGDLAAVRFDSWFQADAYRHEIVTRVRRFAWVEVS